MGVGIQQLYRRRRIAAAAKASSGEAVAPIPVGGAPAPRATEEVGDEVLGLVADPGPPAGAPATEPAPQAGRRGGGQSPPRR